MLALQGEFCMAEHLEAHRDRRHWRSAKAFLT
jgi:hypothetical protein